MAGKANHLAYIFVTLVLIGCFISLATLLLVVWLVYEELITAPTQLNGYNALDKKPNILFILLDDAGYNDVGYNNPEVSTPTMDAMARHGRILDQHYMQSVCSPSRHALMTGRYPFKSKMQHFALRAAMRSCSPIDVPFLTQKLKTQGYRTHLLGKWHLGYCQSACMPNQRGLDSFYGMYGAQADHILHESIKPEPEHMYDWHDNSQVDFSANGTHVTDLITDRAVKVLSEHDKSQPFHMLFYPSVPHSPLQAPQRYVDMFLHIKDEQRRLVYAMLAHLDNRIKDVIETLKKTGLYDNTLIIVTSDNGGDTRVGHSNFPLRGGKMSMWEGGSRTFAFVAGPLIQNTGEIHNGLFHVTDWYQTILSIAGLSTDPLSDGVDQSDMILMGRGSKRTEFVYNLDMQPEYNQGQAALRIGSYKLIWGFEGALDGWGKNNTAAWRYPPNLKELDVDPDYMHDGTMPLLLPVHKGEAEVYDSLRDRRWFDPTDIASGKIHLFNLQDDPEERTDLASFPRHQKRLLDMKRRVLALLKQSVQPSDDELMLNTDEMLSRSEQGAMTMGWCEEARLTLHNS